MVAINWGKRIMGIMGSLSNLMSASLLQNRGCIHHFGDRVAGPSVVEGGGDAMSFRRSDD